MNDNVVNKIVQCQVKEKSIECIVMSVLTRNWNNRRDVTQKVFKLFTYFFNLVVVRSMKLIRFVSIFLCAKRVVHEVIEKRTKFGLKGGIFSSFQFFSQLSIAQGQE